MTSEEKVRETLDDKVNLIDDIFASDPHCKFIVECTAPYMPMGYGLSPDDAWDRAWDRLLYIRRQNDPGPFGMTWDMARRMDNLRRELGE